MKASGEFEDRKENASRGALRKWVVLAGCLGISFLFTAILYVWLYMQQIQNGYKLAKLYEKHEQLLAIQRKLRLEWSRFQDPYQMEELGRQHFGLNPPRQDQRILMR